MLSGCGGELSGPCGSFHSPGYPNRYPSNRECIWYIQTTPGSSIQLTIQEFDVEYHPNCNYDVLEVRELDLVLKNTQGIGFSVWSRSLQGLQEQNKQSNAISPFCYGYSPEMLSQKPQCSYFFLCFFFYFYAFGDQFWRQNCFEKPKLLKILPFTKN